MLRPFTQPGASTLADLYMAMDRYWSANFIVTARMPSLSTPNRSPRLSSFRSTVKKAACSLAPSKEEDCSRVREDCSSISAGKDTMSEREPNVHFKRRPPSKLIETAVKTRRKGRKVPLSKRTSCEASYHVLPFLSILVNRAPPDHDVDV